MKRNLEVGLRLLAALGLTVLVGCDRPGPLSAAAKGRLPTPPPRPAWSEPFAWRPLKSVFPGEVRCVGSVDGAKDRYLGARKVLGWAWNATSFEGVARLAVVNENGMMVGFGEGGSPRPDVTAARPEVRSAATGWWVIAPTRKRNYSIWAIDEASRSACRVGEVRL